MASESQNAYYTKLFMFEDNRTKELISILNHSGAMSKACSFQRYFCNLSNWEIQGSYT